MAKTKKPKLVSLKSRMEHIVDEKTEEALKNLPERVAKVIDQSILSLLGLSAGYRHNEIDHCNGRWNMFAEVLKAEAIKDVSEIVKNLKTKFDIKDFKVAFQKEYLDHFRHALKYRARTQAEELAEEYIKKHLDELIPKKLDMGDF